MSEKKMVTRSVAIGLGIICIILIVGFVGAFAIYMPALARANSLTSSLQTQNSQLQIWLDGNKTDYQNYKNSHSHSDSEYNMLQSIANLGEQQIILNQYTTNQGANTHNNVTGFQANYAGYLHISLTSTTSSAYVIVEYWFLGKLFSVTKTLGTSGDAYYVLMPSYVVIYVGNTDFVGVTDTITATYYY
jgi:hypothetical protein